MRKCLPHRPHTARPCSSALPSRGGDARHFISLTVGLEDFEILLELLPADVAGMGIWDARQPVLLITPLQDLFTVDGSSIAPASVGVGAGVTWVVQDTYCRRCGQWPKNGCLAVAQTRGKQKAFRAKGLDGLACGAHARERVEEMDDCLPNLRVGIERHVAGLVIDQPGWQWAAVLAASHLVEDSTT